MKQSNHLGMDEVFKKNWKLNYYFVSPSQSLNFYFSFNPKDSDFIQNTTLLNSLVGTLVKYNKDGRLSPYLAEEFSVSPNKLLWKFKIRKGLACERGLEISAERYVRSLTRQLWAYSQAGDALDFENLKGWKEFRSQKIPNALPGLRAENDRMIFEFIKAPSDLLEFLRMPYFGFWCEGNFNDSGKWKDNFYIESSGSYVLEEVVPQKKVILKKRNDWFSIEQESPNKIEFGVRGFDQINAFEAATFFEFSRPIKYEVNHNASFEIKGTPTVLLSIILSPYLDGFFKEIQNRRAFMSRIRKLQGRFARFNSRFFYFNAKTNVAEVQADYTTQLRNKKIQFAIASTKFDPEDLKNLKELIDLALADAGVESEILIDDPHKEEWYQKVDSNKHFDARIAVVDIGGYVINAAVKMMFCSTMGINFPDPSGRICALVNRQDEVGGEIPHEYVEEFNKVIMEDACVIPVYHFGFNWIVSKDIDNQSVNSVSMTPLFESIRKR